MTIDEAEKQRDKLIKQILAIHEEHDFDGFARYMGNKKAKPLEKECERLILAIFEAKKNTIIF
ncbi:hypothetical protein LCGC14_1756490 [marine sediment metagenome]|uniref:Uncharacterized protein n=1 Tax=marine sediment metagenome TaxID=412755 RepID=A0A0F9JHE7_9ZZZZ